MGVLVRSEDLVNNEATCSLVWNKLLYDIQAHVC